LGTPVGQLDAYPGRLPQHHSSDQGGECVEFAEAPATIAIRDSKNPAGPVLTLRPDAFRDFVSWTGTGTTPGF